MRKTWRKTLADNKLELGKFAFALLIGLSLEIILSLFAVPGLKFVRETGDDLADKVMRLAALSNHTNASPTRFAFIQIDDDTWLSWNAPLITPRDKIAAILETISRSGPKAIVLDVDLAFRDYPDSGLVLYQFLSSYPPEAPPLILVRSLRPVIGSALPVQRAASFEPVPHKRNIIWALPSFLRDDDGLVRRWELATAICEQDGAKMLASVQLAAAYVWAGNSVEALAEDLKPFSPSACAAPDSQTGVEPTLKASNLPPIAMGVDDASTRVMYGIKWAANAAALGPELQDGSYRVLVRSADSVSRMARGDSLAGVEGMIVVIGGAYADSGDWHQTPLGAMPGSLVIINAIDALTTHGTPQEPGWVTRLALVLLMIAAVSLCVTLFRPFFAGLLSLAGIGLVMVISLPFFKSGMAINLAAPSLGILIADGIGSFIKAIGELHRLGWRWFLRPGMAVDKREREAGNEPLGAIHLSVPFPSGFTQLGAR